MKAVFDAADVFVVVSPVVHELMREHVPASAVQQCYDEYNNNVITVKKPSLGRIIMWLHCQEIDDDTDKMMSLTLC